MRKVQSRLSVALLFTALALLAFFVTAFLSGQIDFLYRDAAGLGSARNIAQIVALMAVAVMFIAGLLITVPYALQPASFAGKIAKVLPLFLLLAALAAVISGLMGIGSVGGLFNLQGVGQVTFIAAWLGLATVLAVIAVVIAAARANLTAATITSATRATVAGSGLTAIATVAMLVSMVIVATSQPASFGRPGGGFPGGPQEGNRPGAEQNAPGGASGQNAQRPEGTNEPQAGFPRDNRGQNGGFPPAGEGRPEGGPGGGGIGNAAGRFATGGALMTLFAVIGLASAISGLMALRQIPSVTEYASAVTVNYSRQGGLALLSLVGIGLVVLGVMQLVPVSRDNPPVKTTINWDSEQTKTLAYATCMDCHSNETTWPWYTSIAPSSWLTALHVKDGRQELNLSEMDNMPAFRRNNLAQNMAEQIRSGNMPPKDYLILHPDARLTDAQKEDLITGLRKSLGGS
ncbi:MAG: hypothetical protein GC179_01010 [Anaerolineaceae bacterium]|nr:hypothetical protein [Anaerolineaceae bacterium]